MRCTIETRDFGTMVFTLYPEYAPLTVANFVKTARSGFYDGLCWCRIVKDYVIQGGSPDNDIMTDSDWHIKGEFTENGVNNPLKHIRGALSMARDDDFDTAGTQFFVVHKDAAKLRSSRRAAASGARIVTPPLAKWRAVLMCWTPLPTSPLTALKPGTSPNRCLSSPKSRSKIDGFG